MAKNLSQKIAQLPIKKQQEMLKKVLEDGARYRIHTLSPQQNRMWFLYNLDKEDTGYIGRFRFVIEGRANKVLLDKAMTELLCRHKILRTVYLSIEGIPFQTWEDVSEFSSEYLDGRKKSEEEIDKHCLKMVSLDSEIPIKIWYVELEKETWYIWNIHHIVHDGWSIGLLLNEFYDIYERLKKGADLPEQEKFYDYFDYIKETERKRKELESSEKISYWENYLGYDLFSVNFMKKKYEEAEAENVYALPGKKMEEKLGEFARNEKTTVFNVLLALWLYLMEIYNQGENVNVGIPVLNRPSVEQLKTVGYFANTIVMKSDSKEIHSFSEYIKYVTNTVATHLKYGDLPFEWLVNRLKVPRLRDSNPVFNVMFSMQTKALMKNGMGESRRIEGENFHFSPYYSKYRMTNFALTLTVIDTVEGLSMGFSYDKKIFARENVIQIKKDYETMLKLLSEGVDIWKQEYREQPVFRFFKNPFSEFVREGSEEFTEESKMEKEIKEIWGDVLGHRQFSVTQAFFDVGGNSINCFQLLKKLENRYEAGLKIAQLFEYKSIRAMAGYLEKALGKKEEDTEVKIQMF